MAIILEKETKSNYEANGSDHGKPCMHDEFQLNWFIEMMFLEEIFLEKFKFGDIFNAFRSTVIERQS